MFSRLGASFKRLIYLGAVLNGRASRMIGVNPVISSVIKKVGVQDGRCCAQKLMATARMISKAIIA
jgi:hypothetical protein